MTLHREAGLGCLSGNSYPPEGLGSGTLHFEIKEVNVVTVIGESRLDRTLQLIPGISFRPSFRGYVFMFLWILKVVAYL